MSVTAGTIRRRKPIRILKPGEPIPEGAPKRYRSGKRIFLRWTLPDEYVQCQEHDAFGDLLIRDGVVQENRWNNERDRRLQKYSDQLWQTHRPRRIRTPY